MNNRSNTDPTLMLGTAMWGWTIPKARCFEILDTFYEEGFRVVDGATNYPINKNPSDFRLSENILQEWLKANRVNDLQVMMKIGSINNMRSPEHNLSYSFMVICLDEYLFKLGENLHTLMIHWDNREEKKIIRQSFEALQVANNKGLKVGLSGIRHPEIYAKLNQEFQLDFCVQIKHNLLHSDYKKYKAFHGTNRFITYGINAGGLKLDAEDYHADSSLKARGGNIADTPPIVNRLKVLLNEENKKDLNPPIKQFNECSMTYAYYSPDIMGILLGSSSSEQLLSSIHFYRLLQKGHYTGFYKKLCQIV